MSTQKDHVSPPELAEPALRRTVSPDTHEPDRKTAVQSHGEGYDDEGHDHVLEWPEMLRIALVAVAAASVWWRVWEPFPAISLIGVAGLVIGGLPIVKEGLEDLLGQGHTTAM